MELIRRPTVGEKIFHCKGGIWKKIYQEAMNYLLFNYSMYSSISHHWFSDVGTCSGSDEQHLVQDDLQKNQVQTT
jgi:hypothetical protein